MTEKIQRDVSRERKKQDNEWGGPEHDDRHDRYDWIQFIEHQISSVTRTDNPKKIRRRFVKIAALALAALESMDRQEARRPDPNQLPLPLPVVSE